MYISKQRPGVFSKYTINSGVGNRYSDKAVGLICISDAGEFGKVFKINRLSDLNTTFGNTGIMANMGEILFNGGISKLYCVAVYSGSDDTITDYKQAFNMLDLFEDIGGIVCDSTDIEVQKLLKESIIKSSDSLRERIGFCGVESDQAVNRSNQLDCERMCLTTPMVKYNSDNSGSYLSAVYAAIAVGSNDSAQNLNMAQTYGSFIFSENISEEFLDELIESGVTVFEPKENSVSLIRAVTTRAGSQKESHGFGELSTVRIADDVMITIRNMLKTRLSGAKNSKSTLESIRTQTVLELENKLVDEIISAYDPPLVYISPDDSTVCVVEISFRVMHIMHQIQLTAYISV